MSAPTRIQATLKAFSAKSLFTANGDELISAKKYYLNGLDCLFAAITQAARRTAWTSRS